MSSKRFHPISNIVDDPLQFLAEKALRKKPEEPVNLRYKIKRSKISQEQALKIWDDPENGPPEAKKRHQKEKIVDLDITRELPIKKPLSAYVHYLNEGR